MNDEDHYISTKQARKMLGVTTTTLRNWDSSGRISTIRTPSNQRLYNLKDIKALFGSSKMFPQKQKVAYCRVSSKKQKDDLRRQEDFFRTIHPTFTIISDIGSGINWKRKGLKAILEGTFRGDISEVMVAHKDRLCRFSFELLEWIFEEHNVKLTILDHEEQQSPDVELADDILSIVHVYSCRRNGHRRYSKSKNSTVFNCESETDFEEVERDH